MDEFIEELYNAHTKELGDGTLEQFREAMKNREFANNVYSEFESFIGKKHDRGTYMKSLFGEDNNVSSEQETYGDMLEEVPEQESLLDAPEEESSEEQTDPPGEEEKEKQKTLTGRDIYQGNLPERPENTIDHDKAMAAIHKYMPETQGIYEAKRNAPREDVGLWNVVTAQTNNGLVMAKIGEEFEAFHEWDDITNMSIEKATRLAELYAEQDANISIIEKYKEGDGETSKFIQDAIGGTWSSMVGLATNPLFYDKLESAGIIGGSAGLGALGGAGMPGAISGGLRGLYTVMTLSGADLESGAVMAQRMRDYGEANGIALTPEGIQKISQDTEFMTQARKDANTAAGIVTIAGILTAGVGSRVASKLAPKITNATRAVGASALVGGIEMAGEAAGEATKQYVIDGEVDGREVWLEAIGAPIMTAMGESRIAATGGGFNLKKKYQEIINKNKATDQIIDAMVGGQEGTFNQTIDNAIEQMGMSEERAKETSDFIKSRQDQISEAIKQLPQEDLSESQQREAVQKLLSISDIDNEIASISQKIEGKNKIMTAKSRIKRAGLERQRNKIEESLNRTAMGGALKSLEDHNSTRQLSSAVQALAGLNHRPTAADIYVNDNEVFMDDPSLYGVTKQAVDAINQLNKEQDNGKPELKISDSGVAAQRGVKLDFDTADGMKDITVEWQGKPLAEGSITAVVDGNEMMVETNLDPLITEEQESVLMTLVKDSREKGLTTTTSGIDPETGAKVAWDNLVNNGYAKYDAPTDTYTVLSKDESAAVAKQKLEAQAAEIAEQDRVKETLNGEIDDNELRGEIDAAREQAKQLGTGTGQKYTVKVVDGKQMAKISNGKAARGMFVDDFNGKRTIYINRDDAKRGTVRHELAHAIMSDRLTGQDAGQKLQEMEQVIREVSLGETATPEERAILAELNDMLDSYREKGHTDKAELAEEFIAELATFLSLNGSRLDAQPTVKKKIITAINQIIEALTGIPDAISNVEDINEAIEFVNRLADELSGKSVVQAYAPPKPTIDPTSTVTHNLLGRYTNVTENFYDDPKDAKEVIKNSHGAEVYRFPGEANKGDIYVLMDPADRAAYMQQRQQYGSKADRHLDDLGKNKRPMFGATILDLRKSTYTGAPQQSNSVANAYVVPEIGDFENAGVREFDEVKDARDTYNQTDVMERVAVKQKSGHGKVFILAKPEDVRANNEMRKNHPKGWIDPFEVVADQARPSAGAVIIDLRNALPSSKEPFKRVYTKPIQGSILTSPSMVPTEKFGEVRTHLLDNKEDVKSALNEAGPEGTVPIPTKSGQGDIIILMDPAEKEAYNSSGLQSSFRDRYAEMALPMTPTSGTLIIDLRQSSVLAATNNTQNSSVTAKVKEVNVRGRKVDRLGRFTDVETWTFKDKKAAKKKFDSIDPENQLLVKRSTQFGDVYVIGTPEQLAEYNNDKRNDPKGYVDIYAEAAKDARLGSGAVIIDLSNSSVAPSTNAQQNPSKKADMLMGKPTIIETQDFGEVRTHQINDGKKVKTVKVYHGENHTVEFPGDKNFGDVLFLVDKADKEQYKNDKNNKAVPDRYDALARAERPLRGTLVIDLRNTTRTNASQGVPLTKVGGKPATRTTAAQPAQNAATGKAKPTVNNKKAFRPVAQRANAANLTVEKDGKIEVGVEVIYDGESFQVSKINADGTFTADSNQFVGKIENITSKDSMFEGVVVNNSTKTRLQRINDVRNTKRRQLLEDIRNNAHLSPQDKEQMIRVYGLEDIAQEQAEMNGEVPPKDGTTVNEPIGDAFDQLDYMAGKIRGKGVKVDNATIEQFLKNVQGVNWENNTTPESFRHQLEIAYARGYVDDPGQPGMRTAITIAKLAEGRPIDNYEFIGLIIAYSEAKESLRIEQEAQKKMINPLNEARIQELQGTLVHYADFMRIAKTIYGRGLQLASQYQTYEFNPHGEIEQLQNELGNDKDIFTKERLAELRDAAEEMLSAQIELEKARNDRDGRLKEVKDARVQGAIKEILQEGEIDSNYREVFASSLRMFLRNFGGKKGIRFSLGEDIGSYGKDAAAQKYAMIYKMAKNVILAGKASTVEDIYKVMLPEFNAVAEGQYEFEADDIATALELGLTDNRKVRKETLLKRINRLKQLKSATDAIMSLNHQMGNVVTRGGKPTRDAANELYVQLEQFGHQLLQDGFGIKLADNDIMTILNTLQEQMKGLDPSSFENGTLFQPDTFKDISSAMGSVMDLLGADVVNTKADVSNMAAELQQLLDREANGEITSTEMNTGKFPMATNETRMAETRMILATRKFQQLQKKAKRLGVRKEMNLTQKMWDSTGNSARMAWESIRQAIFTADISFLGLQNAISLMSIMPMGIVNSIQSGSVAPAVNAFKFSTKMLTYLVAKGRPLATSGGVEKIWVEFNGDPFVAEMRRIQPDSLTDPTAVGDSASREEVFGANIGGKLREWGADLGAPEIVSKAVAAIPEYSSNAFTMFTNEIRREQYRQFVEMNPHATEAQRKIVIQGIMDFTGRGVSRHAISSFVVGKNLAYIFAAPRLYLSRINVIKNAVTVTPHIIAGLIAESRGDGELTRYAGEGVSESRINYAAIHMAKQYVTATMGAFLLHGVLSSFDWELEDDQKDKDFLKYKRGHLTLDASAGLSMYLKTIAFANYERMKNSDELRAEEVYGRETSIQQKENAQRGTMSDVFKNLRYKLHPGANFVANQFLGTDILGRSFGITPEQALANRAIQATPITVQTLVDSWREDDRAITPDNVREYEEASGMEYAKIMSLIGFGIVDYDNQLDHVEVQNYLNNLYGENNGWVPTITKKHAIDHIRGSSNEKGLNYMRETSRVDFVTDGFKTTVESAIGQYILDQVARGRKPTKEDIQEQQGKFMEEYGKKYYNEWIKPYDEYFTELPKEYIKDRERRDEEAGRSTGGKKKDRSNRY